VRGGGKSRAASLPATASMDTVRVVAGAVYEKVGTRRLLTLARRADSAVAVLLQLAESSIRRAVPPRARVAAGAYLASASGQTKPARLANAACAAVATSDGLPLALVAVLTGIVCGYVLCLVSALALPALLRGLRAVPRTVRRLALASPIVRSRVDAEVEKLRTKLRSSFAKHADGLSFTALPAEGLDGRAVERQLTSWSEREREHWVSGKLSGAVYHSHDRADRAAVAAFAAFSLSNPVHPSVFPAVRRMESEVIAMTAELFRCPTFSCGALTSGGTESILMAVRAYRQQARARGVESPNLVVAETVHAAFDKACDYFCVEIRKVPCDAKTLRAVPRAMQRRIDRNTIALACSAVAFPHGTLDPVSDLAAVAKRHGVGLHVDSCLGSFLLPFAAEAGFPVAPFDFGAGEGVTSISVDQHKYGLAPKGVSCVLFRTAALRAFMFTRASTWQGGIYATATASGSRPGALVAGAWAAMVVTGRNQYLSQARTVLTAARRLKEGIQLMDGLRLVGDPALSVVAFTTTARSRLNVFNLLDMMTALGWELNALQSPAALHACVTMPMAPMVDALLRDLKSSLEALVKLSEAGALKDGADAALYGMNATVPVELTDECIDAYLECVLTPTRPREQDVS
jgi:sphinganine-1-phosphate aldolase